MPSFFDLPTHLQADILTTKVPSQEDLSNHRRMLATLKAVSKNGRNAARLVNNSLSKRTDGQKPSPDECKKLLEIVDQKSARELTSYLKTEPLFSHECLQIALTTALKRQKMRTAIALISFIKSKVPIGGAQLDLLVKSMMASLNKVADSQIYHCINGISSWLTAVRMNVSVAFTPLYRKSYNTETIKQTALCLIKLLYRNWYKTKGTNDHLGTNTVELSVRLNEVLCDLATKAPAEALNIPASDIEANFPYENVWEQITYYFDHYRTRRPEEATFLAQIWLPLLRILSLRLPDDPQWANMATELGAHVFKYPSIQ